MRLITRPCYDKYDRCPGWAGAGVRPPRAPWCRSGARVLVDYSKPSWAWRMHRCEACYVLVAPYVIRWVDPTFLRWSITWRRVALASWLRNGDAQEPTPSVPTLMTCRCGAQAYWYPRVPGVCASCGAHWRWRDGS